VVVTIIGMTFVIVVVVDTVTVDTLGEGVTVVVGGPSPLYIPPRSSNRLASAYPAAAGVPRRVLLRCPPPLLCPPLCSGGPCARGCHVSQGSVTVVVVLARVKCTLVSVRVRVSVMRTVLRRGRTETVLAAVAAGLVTVACGAVSVSVSVDVEVELIVVAEVGLVLRMARGKGAYRA
jgi:hypothetical protein